ncbi:MAG: metallophosphoesterase [Polyangiales bacterium]
MPQRASTLRERFIPAACAAALSLAPSVATAEEGIRKGPWLMSPRVGGVTVLVERQRPGPVTVRAWELVPEGDPEPQPITVNDGAETALHELRLAGLTPGGRYRYEVSGPGLETARGTFNTMPDAFVPFRFVLYGDTRSDHRSHAATMRAIGREGADFVVHTGDLVGDGRREEHWQRFFTIERDVLRNAAWVPVVGNHELHRPSRVGIENFRRYVHCEEDSPRPELDYTLRYGNVRLVMANAFDNWAAPRMRAWLDGQLTRARAEGPEDFLLVVLHWGMHSSGPHGENGNLRGAGLADLFRRHNVDLVVAGHDHIYERGEERGLRYMVTGGSGAPLYKHATTRPYTQVFARQHHYVRVDVERDALSLVALRPDGSVLDRFTIRHPNARARVRATAGAARRSWPVLEDPPEPSHRVTTVTAPPPQSCLCGAPGLGRSGTADARGTTLALALSGGLALAFSRRRRR